MLNRDRVFCDVCEREMGQLHHQAAPQTDLLTDQRIAPHFAVCPDCLDNSVASQPQGQEVHA